VGQEVQTPVPLPSLYVPGAQEVHGPPSSPMYPASQRQWVILLERSSERECAGHAEQLAEPLTSLYVSRAHPSQSPPSGPVNPRSQVQEESAALPSRDHAWRGHGICALLSG